MLVCENHRDKAWPDECDCGPGMLKVEPEKEAAGWFRGPTAYWRHEDGCTCGRCIDLRMNATNG